MRRPARNQELPVEEIALLGTLAPPVLYIRVRELYDMGWTLRSIGEALTPKRPRSTIRYWISRPVPITGAMPLPLEDPPTPQPPSSAAPKPKRGLSGAEAQRLAELAPVARRFRASMSPSHTAALANRELSEFALRLYNDTVPIRELASGCNVSYRAMARRIEKAQAA